MILIHAVFVLVLGLFIVIGFLAAHSSELASNQLSISNMEPHQLLFTHSTGLFGLLFRIQLGSHQMATVFSSEFVLLFMLMVFPIG